MSQSFPKIDNCGYDKCYPRRCCKKDPILVCGKSLPVDFNYCSDDHQTAAFVEVNTRGFNNPVVKVNFCANVFAKVTDSRYRPDKVKLVFKLFKRCENGDWILVKRWFYLRDLRKYYYWGGGGRASAVMDQELEGNNELDDNNEEELNYENLNEEQLENLRQEESQRCGGRCSKLALKTEDSFCFHSCECNTCPACCVYKVVIENCSYGCVDIAIRDSEIDAIAQSQC